MRDFTEREEYWLWLNSITGANPPLFHKILARFSGPEEIYRRAEKNDLGDEIPFVSDTMRTLMVKRANRRYIDQYIRWLKRNEVDAVTEEDPRYPALLREIHQPPTVLFVRGRLETEAQLPIAVIGMRENTDYGERVARRLGRELAQSGATVVSGMAYGIDSIAAQGALSCKQAQYPTVAVMGGGVDVIYPSAHARLYQEIVERGAVISEFLPQSKPLPGNFPMRNRIISGLSLGVVVVEAGEKSGTSITVNYALEQDREIFAVPGEIDKATSAGPNNLIRQGCAKPVFDTNDILEEFGFELKTPEAPPSMDPNRLPEPQRAIYRALQKGPKTADELCEMLELPIAEVNSALTSMQFSGIMKQLPGRVYSI